ncbi:MAG: 3-isopropylmalate dehydratase small subunit, partial [Bacillota bacterium]
MDTTLPPIVGRAHCFGDNIDTDVIISGKHMISTELADMLPHLFEAIAPGFNNRVQPGDVIVGGRNFGCGSSRETAPALIKAAGIRAIIAESFARIFFRNAINLGLVAVECPNVSTGVSDGDVVRYDPATGVVENLTTSWRGQGTVLPDFLVEILLAGGAVEACRRKCT